MAANSDKTPRRRGLGRPWQKGQSGNPKGRPKKVLELLELARADVPEAFELARKLMKDGQADPKLRLEAARFLTSYGVGGPPKSTVLVDEDDEVQSAAPMDVETARQVLKLVKREADEPADDSE